MTNVPPVFQFLHSREHIMSPPTTHSPLFNAGRIAVCAILLLIGTASAAADTKGKISGRILDKATEPVIGANVLVAGTTMGAASDADGFYVILNIPPGTYQLRVSSIGFATQVINGVRVSAGQTTTINVSLAEESVELEEVVVQARQPIVDVRQTSSVAILSKENIQQLPVQDLSDIVNLQAGVVDGHFRGGRLGEVQYQVDGVSVNNPYDNSSSLKLDRSVLEEVQVISGTFDAEYGQAMSGVVNAVLRSGSEKAFEWAAEVFGGDYVSGDTEHFPHINERSVSAIQNYQLTVSGPVPIDRTTMLVGIRRYHNEGSMYGERRFLPGDSSNFETQTFNPTGNGEIVSLSGFDEWSGQLKISNRSIEGLQLSYQAIGNILNSQLYSHNFRINPEGARKQESRSLTHGIDLTHVISPTLFYTVNLRQNYFRYTDYVYSDVFDPRYIDYGQPLGDRNYEDGAYVQGVDLTRFEQETNSWILKGALTSQVTTAHMVKIGAEAQTSEVTFGPPGSLVPTSVGGTQVLVPVVDSPDYPGLRTYHPVWLSGYIQDRIEFQDLMIRAGLRLEYFDARSTVPSDLQNPANSISGAPESTPTPTTPKTTLAPRIGISYPVAVGASVYFSYGHFYQIPGLGLLFSNSDYSILRDLQAGTPTALMGNPDLEPELTVQYEFGAKAELSQSFGFDVSAYYKDIRNLLGVEFVSTYAAAQYGRFTNVDFGGVAGFTVSLQQRSGMLSSSLAYTSQGAVGNSSDPRETYNRALANEDPRPRQVPFTWDQLHTLNASATVSKAGDFNVTAILRYGTGQPYTPTVLSRLGANLETNSARKATFLIIDLRGEKSFTLFGTSMSVFARVFNLLDEHAVNGFVFTDTGSPYYTLNVAGNAALLTDPSRFYQPRRFEIGLSFNGSSE